MSNRNWSQDDDTLLLDMRAKGMPYAQIGSILGRTGHSCAGRFDRLRVRGGKTLAEFDPRPPMHDYLGERVNALVADMASRYRKSHGVSAADFRTKLMGWR